jgi:rod shape-determining protein MreB
MQYQSQLVGQTVAPSSGPSSSGMASPFAMRSIFTSAPAASHGDGHRRSLDFKALGNLRPLTSLFSNDLAIDLGTTNTRIFARDRGIVVNEPSAVAGNTASGELEAVGKEAWEMLGRAPGHIRVVRPMKNGVIADFKLAQAMLDYFIRKAHNRRTLVHPRIVISVPSEITQVERRAVTDSAYRAKASEVHLVEQAMMAAIGAGLPVSKAGGNMVVDIGGGTADVAVISFNGIVYARSLRVAGNHMDEAIIEYVKRKHNLLIGERTAERIKMELGSATACDKPRRFEVKGRDLVENVPKGIVLNDGEIRAALNESISLIVAAIRTAVERIPPEIAADIRERGIVLTGGGALLRNLDCRIREDTGSPVVVADDPLCSGARERFWKISGCCRRSKSFKETPGGTQLGEPKRTADEPVRRTHCGTPLAGRSFLRSGRRNPGRVAPCE